MEKEEYIIQYEKRVNKNYDELSFFINDNLHILSNLKSVKYEIINCLMIEQFQASITITNHFLEKMLKSALISKYIEGLKFSDSDELNLKLKEAYKKYDDKTLKQSIDSALEIDIINKDEFNYINKVRDDIRNAFSHAQMDKINKGKPERIKMFSFNINEVQKSIINTATVPKGKELNISTQELGIQALIQEDHSKSIAYTYFKSIYTITKNIDVRLDFKKEYYTKNEK
ncbi:hypothetical protein [uncultured Aquimarina sp.]|uniref:hypothetical protein n=1 Tax=uncultured Aquimarina sp. TaxID=575652 RepID=UPI002624512C|nr:hypothetical protein [uncultured Aquimarina sp.]